MEFGGVVVADQPGRLLVVARLELDDGAGAVAERLLPPGHERLAEHAADGVAAEQAQMAGPGREAEQLGPVRGAQPLEVDRQVRPVELGAGRRGRERVRRQVGQRGAHHRRPAEIRHQPGPAVRVPAQRRDRRFAAEHGAAAVAQRAAAEADDHGLARPRVGPIGVAGPLQHRVGPVAAGDAAGCPGAARRGRDTVAGAGEVAWCW